MAVISLANSFCYVGNVDFTTEINTATIGHEVATLDATTFGSDGWSESAAGLKSVNFAYSGFWRPLNDWGYIDIDAGTSRVCTVGPSEVEGLTGVAYMFQATNSQYSLGGQVGELMPFSVTASGSNGVGVVRGRVAKTMGAVSATGALGTALNLGAVASTKSLYATLHITGTAGTTITVQVQSDDNSGFTTPTTVATLGPLTAIGGTWMTPVAGALTDTWYRFNVSAITGTFTVAGAIGIQ